MLGTVCSSEVSPGGNNHADATTNDGDEGSNHEGNSSGESFLGEEGNDDEHDNGEDKADDIFLLEELICTLNKR